MIRDLDPEIRKRNLDGIMVLGDTTLANPDLTYVVGGNLARGGMYFKRMGKDPLLVVSGLDIGTAKKLGRVRKIQTYTQWGLEKMMKRYRRRGEATARLIATILKHEGFSRRVGIFGRNDLAYGTHLVDRLRELEVKVVGGKSPTVIEAARETKGKWELDEIRRIGRKTAAVVNNVTNTLRNARKKRGHLQIGKRRATIGLVKSIISSELAHEGLIAPEGTIFAIGPSGADPHNMGVNTDEIKEGRLIVFDIFPQAESGYWYDLTRTFVIGRADAKSKQLFETVSAAQHASLDVLRAGVTGEDAMRTACDMVERGGYRTIRQVYEGKAKNLNSGFNHSLGHGVGLTIGERPYLAFLSRDPLRSGHVVTVEPGVYLSGYGGVRIEDTVLITPKGFENLAKVENELELA